MVEYSKYWWEEYLNRSGSTLHRSPWKRTAISPRFCQGLHWPNAQSHTLAPSEQGINLSAWLLYTQQRYLQLISISLPGVNISYFNSHFFISEISPTSKSKSRPVLPPTNGLIWKQGYHHPGTIASGLVILWFNFIQLHNEMWPYGYLHIYWDGPVFANNYVAIWLTI